MFEVNCQQKKLKSLKSLSDLQLLVGKPLLELDLKLNQLKDLPSEGFKGLKFKTLHKDMLPVLDVSIVIKSSLISYFTHFLFRNSRW